MHYVDYGTLRRQQTIPLKSCFSYGLHKTKHSGDQVFLRQKWQLPVTNLSLCNGPNLSNDNCQWPICHCAMVQTCPMTTASDQFVLVQWSESVPWQLPVTNLSLRNGPNLSNDNCQWPIYLSLCMCNGSNLSHDNFVLVHCGLNLVRLPDVHGHTAAAVVAVAGRFAGWRWAGGHQGGQLRAHQVRQVRQITGIHLRHQLKRYKQIVGNFFSGFLYFTKCLQLHKKSF